jgi:hypothetical protein
MPAKNCLRLEIYLCRAENVNCFKDFYPKRCGLIIDFRRVTFRVSLRLILKFEKLKKEKYSINKKQTNKERNKR